jgi:CII-binding regulator of phage lambda lysogenization HflD
MCIPDDTSLSYSSTNLLQIERKLNSDMNILNTWAETWLVKFNPQKTEFVISNIGKIYVL